MATLTLKLTAVGDALGVVLPHEALARLGVREGDVVHLVEAAEGYGLTGADPEFERQMAIGRAIMHRHRDALRELAR